MDAQLYENRPAIPAGGYWRLRTSSQRAMRSFATLLVAPAAIVLLAAVPLPASAASASTPSAGSSERPDRLEAREPWQLEQADEEERPQLFLMSRYNPAEPEGVVAERAGVAERASVAEPESKRRRLFTLSALGTDPGQGVVSLGGRVIIVLPAFDFHFLRTYTNVLDIEFRGWSLFGVVNSVEGGIRLALRTEPFSVGLRLNLAAMFGADRSVFGQIPASLGGTAGLHISAGSSNVQTTLGADASLLYSYPWWDLLVRPFIGIEFRTADSTSVYIHLSMWFVFDHYDFWLPLPILAVGATF